MGHRARSDFQRKGSAGRLSRTGVGAAALLLVGCTSMLGAAQSAADASAASDRGTLTIADHRDDGRFDFFDKGLRFDASIPTPQQILGYRIGEHFTRHPDMVRYLETLAAASDRMQIKQYGESHQRRSLHVVTISSPANLARLDEILADNRALATRDLSDARRREIEARNPSIAWFSYTVHGNEASTSETAMQLAYTLAAATNPEIAQWLDNVVLVIDPMLNPDGLMRYVTWFENTRGRTLRPEVDAAEHHEPWPGGRSNHYLFDLNRDWIWIVHPESRSRLKVYRQYLPHLHIDFHEQGYLNPYFFGAGDEPYNANIPKSTRDWIERYGEANAEVFDARGLIYSSRERFDYMYPGYGKVLPVYHGAVGMLAEQAGHSRAGLAIEVHEGYVLTLAERAHNHFLLSMSNLEMTSRSRRGQLERFGRFFLDACDAAVHPAAAYAVLPTSDPHRLEKLWDLLSAHGVEVHVLPDPVQAGGLLAYEGSDDHHERELPAGTWIIRADQPLGHLVSVLFERDPFVSDPDTYDITSWSVPVAFGLDAFQATAPIAGRMERLRAYAPPAAEITGEGAVALIVSSHQHRYPRAFALAAEHKLHGRIAGKDFTIDGRSFPHGSLIVHAVRNDAEAMRAFERDLLADGLSAHRTARGMSEEGPVLGANANRTVRHPKIALLRGSPLSSLSYGQIWHLLDVEMPLPHTPIDVDRIGRTDLSAYNVIVVPTGGNLDSALGRGGVDRVRDWVRAGGTLVAVGGAATWSARSILGIEGGGSAAAGDSDDDAESAAPLPLSEVSWEERRLRGVENRVPGVTLRAHVDETHPLSAGLGPHVGLVKRGGSVLPIRSNASVVARFETAPRVGGAISERQLSRLAGSPLMTMHTEGRGRVIAIAEDPTLRGFKHHATRMLLNAVVLGPSM